MHRRAVLAGALAAACGSGDVRIGLGSGIPSGGISAPADADAVQTDLRLLGLGSKLLAYYDVRPGVSGAQASITLSLTLRGAGASPPTVTIQGALVAPRQCYVTYSVGGALGTMQYVARLGDSVLSGTSPVSGLVDIGNGNTLVFGAGTYATTHIHWTECTSLAELTGRANSALTSALAGGGARYEAYGLNGRSPSLLFPTSALANESGIPALASGVDIPLEVWLLGETYQHISGVGTSTMWAFTNQSGTHNTKSFLLARACGPTVSGLESKYLLQRRDSGAVPATVSLICDQLHSDLDPKVIRSVLTSSGQMHFNGMPGKAAAATLNRGVASTFDRFTVGGFYPGTAGFSSANWWLGRFSALAITQPLTDAEALLVTKALA